VVELKSSYAALAPSFSVTKQDQIWIVQCCFMLLSTYTTKLYYGKSTFQRLLFQL